MSTERFWRKKALRFLGNVLPKINDSRRRKSSVDKCRDLFDALNKIWYDFNRAKNPENILPDTTAIENLFTDGVAEGDQKALCNSTELKTFTQLTPKIMNLDTLRRKNYDPENITENLRKKAEDEHNQLVNAYNRYIENDRSPDFVAPLLKKTAQLLYVVRSNIAHGEKTPRGPDFHKVERDEQVCNQTAPLIELFLDLLLDHPSTKLASYGTFRPEEPNHVLLSDISGCWDDCITEGYIACINNLPYFTWNVQGEKIEMKIFSSPELPKHISRIDSFEGPDYERILIPTSSNNGIVVVNIYAKKDRSERN